MVASDNARFGPIHIQFHGSINTNQTSGYQQVFLSALIYLYN
jgi:hypothetical protein